MQRKSNEPDIAPPFRLTHPQPAPRVPLASVLAILLCLIAVKSRHSTPPANPQWNQTCADGVCFTLSSGGNYFQWLEIEDDIYRLCDGASTFTEVRERGKTKFAGERLTLISDEGNRIEYRLTRAAGQWVLQDPKGKVCTQDWGSQPRVHPSHECLLDNQSLKLDAPRPEPKARIRPHKPTRDQMFLPEIEISKSIPT